MFEKMSPLEVSRLPSPSEPSFSAPFTECVCKHKPHHVSGKSLGGIGPLCIPADQADCKSAGAGVEGVCGSPGWAEHLAGHVLHFPPEGWEGQFLGPHCAKWGPEHFVLRQYLPTCGQILEAFVGHLLCFRIWALESVSCEIEHQHSYLLLCNLRQVLKLSAS